MWVSECGGRENCECGGAGRRNVSVSVRVWGGELSVGVQGEGEV